MKLGITSAAMNGTTKNNANATISAARQPKTKREDLDCVCTTTVERGGNGSGVASTSGGGVARMGRAHCGHANAVSLISRPQSGHLIRGISQFEQRRRLVCFNVTDEILDGGRAS